MSKLKRPGEFNVPTIRPTDMPVDPNRGSVYRMGGDVQINAAQYNDDGLVPAVTKAVGDTGMDPEAVAEIVKQVMADPEFVQTKTVTIGGFSVSQRVKGGVPQDELMASGPAKPGRTRGKWWDILDGDGVESLTEAVKQAYKDHVAGRR